ncbi:MAG TPA: MBL fold metallo-hydrolase [archaeon]|nr:MBL fold metallo-hydrolase [archaeon]
MENKIKSIFVLFYILLFVSYSFAQQRETQPVELRKISDRLYEIIGGRGANGGAYIGDNGVLIIDAKMDQESVDQVIEEIEKITVKPIKYLVNTHSDGDHVTGNRYFGEEVTFIAHENCRKEFFHARRDGTQSEWSEPELVPFVPSLTFRDKMELYLGAKKVELWYFGTGHTTGDAVIYFPEGKTAFLGDQLFLDRAQLIHSYKGGNSFEHVKTLKKMLQTLNAGNFCSGHSDMADREGVRNHIARMEERQEMVRALIEKGRSLEEVKSAFEENEAGLIETIYNEIKSSL